MLLITPGISKSQIVVYGPQFRFTEDFWWSMESQQLSWDWLHLLAASYFDRCPHSSLLGRDQRPSKAAGSLKKQKQKKQTRAHCCSYTSGERKGADRQRHQLAAEIFLLHFGFPYFVLLHTSAPEGFAMPTFPTVGKCHVLAAPTIYITCRQPKIRFCPCSERDGCVAQLSEGVLPGQKFQAHMYVLHLKKY